MYHFDIIHGLKKVQQTGVLHWADILFHMCIIIRDCIPDPGFQITCIFLIILIFTLTFFCIYMYNSTNLQDQTAVLVNQILCIILILYMVEVYRKIIKIKYT